MHNHQDLDFNTSHLEKPNMLHSGPSEEEFMGMIGVTTKIYKYYITLRAYYMVDSELAGQYSDLAIYKNSWISQRE